MQPWNGMDKESLFYLEGWLGALNAPGEWVLDQGGWLHYWPRPGEELAHAEVVAPVSHGFLVFNGGPEKSESWVEHIYFEGLKFRYAELRIPVKAGRPGQAG